MPQAPAIPHTHSHAHIRQHTNKQTTNDTTTTSVSNATTQHIRDTASQRHPISNKPQRHSLPKCRKPQRYPTRTATPTTDNTQTNKQQTTQQPPASATPQHNTSVTQHRSDIRSQRYCDITRSNARTTGLTSPVFWEKVQFSAESVPVAKICATPPCMSPRDTPGNIQTMK